MKWIRWKTDCGNLTKWHACFKEDELTACGANMVNRVRGTLMDPRIEDRCVKCYRIVRAMCDG